SLGESPLDPEDPRSPFTVTCAEYENTGSQGFTSVNSKIVHDHIFQALQLLRATGVAATRADVIGHGVGGLLVRKYIDQDDFGQADNFNEGSINRLITIHTPHLGSRMANEIVRFREAM